MSNLINKTDLENRFYYIDNKNEIYAIANYWDNSDTFNWFTYELAEWVKTFCEKYKIDLAISHAQNSFCKNIFENDFEYDFKEKLEFKYNKDFVNYILENVEINKEYEKELSDDLENCLLWYYYQIDTDWKLIEINDIYWKLKTIEEKYNINDNLYNLIEKKAKNYNYTIIKKTIMGHAQSDWDEYSFLLNTKEEKLIEEFKQVIKNLKYLLKISDLDIKIIEKIERQYYNKNEEGTITENLEVLLNSFWYTALEWYLTNEEEEKLRDKYGFKTIYYENQKRFRDY